MPGVQFLPGAHGGTFGVETVPGVRYYRGEFDGSAIETAPGVRTYIFREPSERQEPPTDAASDDRPSWQRHPRQDDRPSWERR
jgi:hypothetical protein